MAKGDGERARGLLLELGVPAYHHELVTLVIAIASANAASGPCLLTLLDLLAESGTVSQVSSPSCALSFGDVPVTQVRCAPLG